MDRRKARVKGRGVQEGDVPLPHVCLKAVKLLDSKMSESS